MTLNVVRVFTSDLWMTNSAVVAGAGTSRLIVDPGVFPRELDALADAAGGDVAAGIATHAHWDHVLWSARLGVGVPRYATPETVALAANCMARDHLATWADKWYTSWDQTLVGQLQPLAAGAALPWDGPEVRLIACPGHMRGHAAVWLPEQEVLLAGDMLSEVEIPLLDPDDPSTLRAYRQSLDTIAALPVKTLVPGHGHAGDRAEFFRRVDADRRYLDDVVNADDPRFASPNMRSLHDENVAVVTGQAPPSSASS